MGGGRAGVSPIRCENGRRTGTCRLPLKLAWNHAVKIYASCCALVLAGCGSVLHVNAEDAQALVTQRLVGTSVGDFFQRYGAPGPREEARDGTLRFTWEGGSRRVAAGPAGMEELLCQIRLTADKSGRIVTATILRDGQGERRQSRCAELIDRS